MIGFFSPINVTKLIYHHPIFGFFAIFRKNEKYSGSLNHKCYYAGKYKYQLKQTLNTNITLKKIGSLREFILSNTEFLK